MRNKEVHSGFLTVPVISLLILFAVFFLAGYHVEAENSYPVTVTQVEIQGKNVLVQSVSTAPPDSDDGLYHLMAQEVYEGGTQGKEIAKAAVSADASFTFPLSEGTADSRLYQKFVIVVYQSGNPVQVSNAQYITNPEAAGGKNVKRLDTGGKKGFLLDAHIINTTNYLTEAGIDQITYNLPIGNLCSDGNVAYKYNGKTYYFNDKIIGQYDQLVPKMNKLGISVTMILLNNKTSNERLIHPFARGFDSANYYAFNTGDADGVHLIEAVASFLADRYSGGKNGTIDNWIIGNEANAFLEWNYINSGLGINYDAGEYAKAVRIFYNAIRAKNHNARVYMSIDHEWAKSDAPGFHYAGKDFLEAANAYLSAEGNISYGVAVHPYNVPMYNAQTWATTPYVTQDESSAYITMANIAQLTDLLCTEQFLQPDGDVRSVLCSEVGYTSLPYGGYYSDETVQAVALAFGYLQAAENQYIDGFFNREVDAQEEIEQYGLALGTLATTDDKNYQRKLSYDFYKNVDNPAHPEEQANIRAACGSVMGADINTILTPR